MALYAPIDAANVVLLGTAPTAEADSNPYMTSGPDPPWGIYGGPFTPWFAQLAESWPELGHLWLWSWTPIALGRPRPAARPSRVVGAARRRLFERSLCSIPWQDDFPRGNVPTGKDAL